MLQSHGKLMRRLPSAALGGVLLLSVMGCPREDENALVVFGPDSVVVLAPLVTPVFLLPPEGSAEANVLELVSFDPSALDAFGRTTPLFDRNTWPYYRGAYWRWGVNDPDGYDWDTGDVDPRLPALTRTTPLEDPWRMYIAVQGEFAGDGYDIYGETCCLEPGVEYAAGFERMYLTVNGQLDQSQVLLGQPVSEPDQLNYLGGQPGGDHTRRADLFNDGSAYPNEANANPFVFGIVGGAADGYIVLDVVISCEDAAGVKVWMCDGGEEDVDFSPVAPNEAVRHTFPNYNYITIWELNPDGTPNFSRPVLRKQLGVDLSALGGPINNAYAPFPREPLSDAELALGTGAVSRPEQVTFDLDNLKALSGGAGYQLWARLDDGSNQALTFEYTNTVDGDVVEGPTPGTASFAGGPGTHTAVADYPDNATHMFLSIESGAGGPSARQILWAPGLQESGQSKVLNLPVSFGTFGEGRTWDIGGVGTGGLFGEQFRVEYSLLPRPPVGYKYVAWLIGDEAPQTGPCAGTNPCRLPDETFTSPPPEYTVLESADTDTDVSDVVQPLSIVEAFQRICHVNLVVTGEDPETGEDIVESQGPDGCYDFRDFHTFKLTLEPRESDPSAPGPTAVLEGLLPNPKALRR